MNEKYFVHIDKVAKQAKKIGEFVMFKNAVGNFLVTSYFTLNLTAEQFWKVQCKLEIPKLEQWYRQEKEGLEPIEREQIQQIETTYALWIENQSFSLTDTKITLLNGYYLYANEGAGYTCLNQEFVDMLKGCYNLFRSGRVVVIDNVHVIAPVDDQIWIENEFLARKEKALEE